MVFVVLPFPSSVGQGTAPYYFSELSGNSNSGLQMFSLENAWQDKEKARQKELA